MIVACAGIAAGAALGQTSDGRKPDLLPCHSPLIIKDVMGTSWAIETTTDDQGRCYFSVRNTSVGKQHEDIVEKIIARIDRLEEDLKAKAPAQ